MCHKYAIRCDNNQMGAFASDVFPLLLAFLKQSAAESQKRIKDSSFE